MPRPHGARCLALRRQFSVAFNDPVLRVAGMKNDTYGEAKRFFELSDMQLHSIVCLHASRSAKNGSTKASARAISKLQQIIILMTNYSP